MGTIECARLWPSWASLALQQLSWRGTAAARAGCPPTVLLWPSSAQSCWTARSQCKQVGPEPEEVLLVDYVCVNETESVYGLVGLLAELTVTAWMDIQEEAMKNYVVLLIL